MLIKSLYARRFKSLRDVELRSCGTMNVLIGRNNAGKSTILSVLDLLFSHFVGQTLAKHWEKGRESELFTDRDTSKRAQIGVELVVTPEFRKQLRSELISASPQLQRAVDAMGADTSLAIIVAIAPGEPCVVYIERIAYGSIESSGEYLSTDGHSLLSVPQASAVELAALNAETKEVGAMIDGYREMSKSRELAEAVRQSDHHFLRYGRFRPQVVKDVLRVLEGKEPGSWISAVEARIAELEGKMDGMKENSEIETFSGKTRVVPIYARSIVEEYARKVVLRLGERREPIGASEARELLELKTRRGGSVRMQLVQDTVQSLLGVKIDAFQSDRKAIDGEGRRPGDAELDVDEFLIEANGAGVREALRLIIDIELKSPELILLEEPEVHLHPGLERSLESYLRRRSADCQMFVTTHSTNFVDAVEFQNVYVVRRDVERHTQVSPVEDPQDGLSIPSEIGLKLSTLFMYERLVFVEGASDESIIRQYAATSGVDLVRSGVGFVSMGGVKSFAHYAAKGTLDLLFRRRIPLVFVVDRDERNDQDVEAMLAKLEGSAELFVLQRREMENYLLDPSAIADFVNRGQVGSKVVAADVKQEIASVARGMMDEVVRLCVAHRLMSPLIPDRVEGEDVAERLSKVAVMVEDRIKRVASVDAEVRSALEQDWENQCSLRAPGAKILDNVLRRWGRRYRRDRGDGQAIAARVPKDRVPADIKKLLTVVTVGKEGLQSVSPFE